ncbi:MAG: deoxyribose-phosphate aldolase [Bdellovibrionaceae bacterium]|nr:deoxyribose-phosphate aldolase [Pseudobdellovibrionaceae bacterium]
MQSTNSPASGSISGPSDLAAFIDHTLLKADATVADIERLCDEALQFRFKGVCVNSVHLPRVAARLRGSTVLPVCVVGFPLGASLSEVKAAETRLAIEAGAAEIDTVLAIGAIKDRNSVLAENDLRAVVTAAEGRPVKVILETGLLSVDEITLACRLSEAAGAAFVKTATGFLGRGASLEDIRLMKASCSPRMQIKASGGIKTFEQARDLIHAGAHRLGTSSGVALVSGKETGASY